MAKRKGNKAQMVRDALAALGHDAKPAAIQEHIKSAGGPEIPTVMISSYKSSMKAKAGGGGGIFGDIATVRDLIAKHGKADLVRLIDAVG